MAGPVKRYADLVAAGALERDPAQEEAVQKLQVLHDALQGYDLSAKGLFARKKEPPKGLYLWGGVGRGKSLLMDLFYNNVPLTKKRRAHFHEFMAETHDRIAAWRAMDDKERRQQPHFVRKAEIDDPVPHVARAAFEEAHLFCFDEFQVTDIADAMLLGRLFEQLFAFGVVVVTTSNRVPDDLYKDGINRGVFLPFIDMLKDQLEVMELVAARDYRLEQLVSARTYYQPLDGESAAAFNTAWEKMICGGTERQEVLHVKGRELVFDRAARGAVRASFEELCATALGAEDYLSIARHFHTLFLEDIPKLSPAKRNEAKRFVTLIDALYEQKAKLVCTADAPAEALYPAGDGAFEFERTVSRLIEMQSENYLSLPLKEVVQEKD
jgi:cell division protein ZapE